MDGWTDRQRAVEAPLKALLVVMGMLFCGIVFNSHPDLIVLPIR